MAKTEAKVIRCIGCNKIICEAEVAVGVVKINCKCGVRNTITAEKIKQRESVTPFQYGRVGD